MFTTKVLIARSIALRLTENIQRGSYGTLHLWIIGHRHLPRACNSLLTKVDALNHIGILILVQGIFLNTVAGCILACSFRV